LTPLDLVIAGSYVVGILVLGYVVSRSIHGFRDYFVAGGRMTAPLLVCTLVSTYYGLDVLLGGSEVGYVNGIVGWFWYARPYYVAILLTALLLARRLRQRDFLTLPDVAGAAYGKGTRAVVAVASFFYSLPLIALMGIGVLLDIILGIPFAWGVLLGALVSLAYTLMGGLLADAFTDTVQFTLMCVTLGIAAAFSMEALGGVDALRAALPETHFDPRGTYPLPVLVVFSTVALSVFVEPAIYQRIFAAESRKAVLLALGIGIVLWGAYDWVTTLLGMAARAAEVDAEPSYALLTLVVDQLPVGLTGLFVAGVIATGMSTVDSYLLIAGGNLSYDLYRPLVNPDIPDAYLLRLTRWAIVGACVVSVAFALFFTSIVSAWVFMATMLVGTVFVPVVVALFSRRTFRPSAGLASSLTGLVAVTGVYGLVNMLGSEDELWGTVIWTVELGGRSFGIWQEYALLFALPASLLAFLFGEWLGRPAPLRSEWDTLGPPPEGRDRRAGGTGKRDGGRG
jgi:SSS family solute:Na+ symporter